MAISQALTFGEHPAIVLAAEAVMDVQVFGARCQGGDLVQKVQPSNQTDHWRAYVPRSQPSRIRMFIDYALPDSLISYWFGRVFGNFHAR